MRRRVAVSEPDLGVQLDVFDEQRESDEVQILQGPHGVDLNSHLDVFYAILRQVQQRVGRWGGWAEPVTHSDGFFLCRWRTHRRRSRS